MLVADDGPGVSDEAKAKLFDMFYTADNIRGDGRRGLGLGLALCKSIIIAHGGTIEVHDNFPQGTVFRFTLQAEEVSVHE
ncbi:Sensor protein SrrB [compost metagenome]